MEALLSSSAATAAAPTTTILTFLAKPTTISHPKIFPLAVSFSTKTTPHNLLFPISTFSSSVSTKVRAETNSTFTSSTAPLGKNGASYGNRHWMVLVEPPLQQLTTKSQIIDYYVCKLESVLGSGTDAQMCMYDASCDTHFGFCCDIDEETAHDLATVPGVLSVEQDENFGSDDKDYGGEISRASEDSSASSLTSNIKTKKLFVTGLSFYTSEKTLRSAFEGFGELVEVKIIMDKISKRSKGYAFVEYTTEEAASNALREMNGKIINGWMITVDVAKKNPPKNSRGQARPTP